MEGTTQAAALLACIAVTAALCACAGRWPPTLTRAALALLAAVAVYGGAYVAHACEAGDPHRQAGIPAACAAAAILFVRRPVLVAGLAVALAVAAFLLVRQYVPLVHTDAWTGNPSGIEDFERFRAREASEHTEAALAHLASTDEREHAAGWLRDSDVWPALTDREREFDGRPRSEIHGLWHTWLTGLYAKEQVPQGIWYPGGTLRAAAGRLVIRDRMP